MLPSGTRWCELRAGGNESAEGTVEDGQVVRIDYVCRLDDGSRVAGGSASFRLGKRSGVVCHAIEEVVPGMGLGDTRRCRAPPASTRGHALASAPSSEILEYDVTLTGFVRHMKIVTLDEDDRASGSDDPLDALVSFGRRSFSAFARAMSRRSEK